MLNYLITAAIILVFAGIVVVKSKYISTGNDSFFDIDNTKVMRGFAAIIIIMVHVPTAYQNKLQDMIGSFAFVCVSFFFLMSAYGLTYSFNKKPDTIKTFWRKRLPKLLVPNYVMNIILTSLILLLVDKEYSLFNYAVITSWVLHLLLCYLVFWICHKLFKTNNARSIATCVVVTIISIVVYFLNKNGYDKYVAWGPEMMGFVWGILLTSNLEQIKKFLINKWIIKTGVILILSGSIGVAYLKLKAIPFFGDYMLKVALGFVLLLLIVVINAKIKLGNKIGCFLGDISYEIFLVHPYSFRFIEEFLPQLNSGLFILASIVFTIVLSIMIHYICKPIFKKIYKK